MKNKFAALIMATFVATPVMAQNVDNQVFANQNVKAIELSQTEMKETQGEIAPLVLVPLTFMNAAAWTNHVRVHNATGQWASVESTGKAIGIAAISSGLNTRPGAGLLNKGGVFTLGVAAQNANTQAEINRINAGHFKK